MVRDFDTSTSTETQRLVVGNELIAIRRAAQTYNLHADEIGNVWRVTDDDGAVVASFRYTAWGEALPGGFDNVPGGVDAMFVGFYGVRNEPSTGLYLMQERWYDPSLARFVSPDPISRLEPITFLTGALQPLNRFTYAANAPQQGNDPMGTVPVTICGRVVDLPSRDPRVGLRDDVLAALERQVKSAREAGGVFRVRELDPDDPESAINCAAHVFGVENQVIDTEPLPPVVNKLLKPISKNQVEAGDYIIYGRYDSAGNVTSLIHIGKVVRAGAPYPEPPYIIESKWGHTPAIITHAPEAVPFNYRPAGSEHRYYRCR